MHPKLVAAETDRELTWHHTAFSFCRPDFLNNPFYSAVGPLMGLLLCLSMIFPLAMCIRGVSQRVGPSVGQGQRV